MTPPADGETTSFVVGSAVIRAADEVLLVCNQRRGGHTDWTTPGGVIDPGEDISRGIAREVTEETGLIVHSWSGLLYTMVATAPEMGWQLRVEVWEADEVHGELAVGADPDGIVIAAEYLGVDALDDRLRSTAPRWVWEPLLTTLQGPAGPPTTPGHFEYEVRGLSRSALQVTRLR